MARCKLAIRRVRACIWARAGSDATGRRRLEASARSMILSGNQDRRFRSCGWVPRCCFYGLCCGPLLPTLCVNCSAGCTSSAASLPASCERDLRKGENRGRTARENQGQVSFIERRPHWSMLTRFFFVRCRQGRRRYFRTPASSTTRSFLDSSSTCSSSNRSCGQSVRMDIFSGHSTITMAGSAKRSSTPRVSKSRKSAMR